MTPKLFVTCYRHMAIDDFNRQIPAPMTPPLAEMQLQITDENVLSNLFPPYTSLVCVKAEADCALAFGDENIVADPDYHKVDGGERLWYGVTAGSHIAVIEVE